MATHQQRAYGCIPGLRDRRDILAASMPGIIAAPQALPPSVDLRPQVPPVYDQDGIGSCSSNASALMFRFNARKQKLADFDPSRLFVYYAARERQGWQLIDSGSVIADNISVLADPGAPPESDWPYIPSKFAQRPPDSAYTNARGHEATIYMRVDGTIDAMRGCLVAGYPFVFGTSIYSSFEDAKTWQTGDVPDPSGELIGGHAMLAVGYDDATGRFRIRNSWGSGWGAGGNGTMSYGYMVGALTFDLWTIREVTGPIGPPLEKPRILKAIVKAGNRKLKILGSWKLNASFFLGTLKVGTDTMNGGLFVAKRIDVKKGDLLTVLNPDGGLSDAYVL